MNLAKLLMFKCKGIRVLMDMFFPLMIAASHGSMLHSAGTIGDFVNSVCSSIILK